ncbi:hypothetical protein Tco_0899437 [Tanacetum coccineum]
MYQEYLAKFPHLAKALENSKVSFSTPMGGIYGEEDIILKLKKKQRENVVPYTRFLSLLIMYKMKEDYGIDEVTLYPTQIFSVNNWALKPNQPEEPPFTSYMLAICALERLVVFKGPKTSSRAESVSQGAKSGAKTGHKKPTTSSKQPSVSNKEATKGGSSKAPTGSKTSHSKKRNESNSTMVSNPSRPSVSTPMDTKMHKEDQQATGGPSSLGVTRHDVLPDFTAEAHPGLSAPNDFIPPQQGMDEGTKNTSYDHIFAGIDPHVLADQTKSVSEGLETVLTQPTTEKGASSTAIYGDKEEASSTINDKDEPNAKTEDISVPRSSSPRSLQIKELTNQVHILQSQKHKLELEKNKAEAEAVLLKAQTSFPNELKEISTKLEDFTKIATSLTSHVAELKTFQWELPEEFLSLPAKVESTQAKLKTLDTLPILLVNVTKTLNKFAEVLESTSIKAGDQSVPSTGQADTMSAKGEKDINQATISQLF